MTQVQKILKVLKNLIVVILLAAMVVLVFFSVGAKFSPDGLPKLADYRLMVVLSGSMSPSFNAGDVIVVSDTRQKNSYQKGDVITFKDPEDTQRIVTHRIVEVVNDGPQVSYRTKGDANQTADRKLVPSGNVMGRKDLRIPYLGRVVEFSKTKQGLIWMIIVPGIAIILSELRGIGKAITEEIERKNREVVASSWSKEQKE